MVLTFTRIATVALLACVHAAQAAAQRGDVRPMLFGFALDCLNCAAGEGARGRGRGGPPVVSYQSFPRVLSVAPGSAAEQAGVKEGDILQSIDGLSVLTDAGSTRLARAVEGEQVRLGFERKSKPIEISLVLGAAGRKPSAGPTQILSGYIAMQTERGEIKMEVWTDDAIIAQDPTPVDGGGEIVLRIGDKTVIRLRLSKALVDSVGGRSGRGKPEEPREPNPR